MAAGRRCRANGATSCVMNLAHAGRLSVPYFCVNASRRSSAPKSVMRSAAAPGRVHAKVRNTQSSGVGEVQARRRRIHRPCGDNGSVRTGSAQLPLHGGRAPAWLFARMVRLAREIAAHIVQAFGCVLGFDWHSSGVTTTVTGALKEGLRGTERDLGIYVGGGKGAVSRKTPGEIAGYCEKLSIDARPLVYASRMSAKVDSAAVQDGYQLYHHSFFFTAPNAWCVVQQ